MTANVMWRDKMEFSLWPAWNQYATHRELQQVFWIYLSLAVLPFADTVKTIKTNNTKPWSQNENKNKNRPQQ